MRHNPLEKFQLGNLTNQLIIFRNKSEIFVVFFVLCSNGCDDSLTKIPFASPLESSKDATGL